MSANTSNIDLEESAGGRYRPQPCPAHKQVTFANDASQDLNDPLISFQTYPSLERWFGRVAVVTGISSAVGAAVAQCLAQNGLQVVGLTRQRGAVEAMNRKIKACPMCHGEIHAVSCDLLIENDVRQSFQWIASEYGPISILVNAAKVCRPASLTDGPVDAWRAMLSINIMSQCMCTMLAVQSMLKGDVEGHVIQVYGNSSPHTIYSATVHNTEAFSEALRLELLRLKSFIRVSNISHGNVFLDHFGPKVTDKEKRKILASGPYLEPKDIADSVMYLLGTPPHVQIRDIVINPVGSLK